MARASESPYRLAEKALKWTLMFDEVSCVIPGASRVEHIESNVKASECGDITEKEMEKVREIYDKFIRKPVHYLW